jgi:hypothetical protein
MRADGAEKGEPPSSTAAEPAARSTGRAAPPPRIGTRSKRPEPEAVGVFPGEIEPANNVEPEIEPPPDTRDFSHDDKTRVGKAPPELLALARALEGRNQAAAADPGGPPTPRQVEQPAPSEAGAHPLAASVHRSAGALAREMAGITALQRALSSIPPFRRTTLKSSPLWILVAAAAAVTAYSVARYLF